MASVMSSSTGHGENLTERELMFLKAQLCDFKQKDNVCYGYIDGHDSNLEEFLENYMSLSSTCFVRSQCHDKTKGDKRFSSSGKAITNGRSSIPTVFTI